MKPDISAIIDSLFRRFSQEFRQGKIEAFETIMALAIGHAFGCYNPNQWADYLGVPPQKIYAQISTWSRYRLQQVLLKMMVHQAAAEIKAVQSKSAATQSRANITLSVDDSVIDRVGKRLRCTYSWYSGRWKKVVKGQNLLGIVLTINGKVLPLHLLFCSKQGSKHTDKPSLLLSMLTRLKEEFAKHDLDISTIPLTMDSWYVSEPLKQALHELGFTNIVVVGKGSYVFSDGQVQYTASQWKKEIEYDSKLWGIEIPAQRKTLTSPTFGRVNLLFFQKSSTRAYYLMDFSTNSLRSAQMWRCWLAHNLIEQFWKILKSVLSINSMRLRDDGLYTGLLIKIIAYLWLTSFQYLTRCRHLSLTQIMRQIRRESDLMTLLKEHFHLDFLGIPAPA